MPYSALLVSGGDMQGNLIRNAPRMYDDLRGLTGIYLVWSDEALLSGMSES